MFEDLDPKLSRALDELRQEFDDKLNRQRAEIEHLLGAPADAEEATLEVVDDQVSEEARPVTAVMAEAPAAKSMDVVPASIDATIDPLEELKLAAAEVDRAESQADVLDALVRASTRFASRSAVFLHREGALEGWGGSGFGEHDSEVTGLSISVSPGSAWEEATKGTGGVTLTGADCAVVSDALGAEHAEIGVLVPFILQDKLAAIVYADRSEPADVFSVTGLQLLVFIAGQTVETLPIRRRASTSSLQLATRDAVTEIPAAEEPAEEPLVTPEVELEELPVEVEELPVEVEELPIEVEELPIEVEEPPIEVEELPIEVEELPIEVEEPPIEVEELPIEPEFEMEPSPEETPQEETLEAEPMPEPAAITEPDVETAPEPVTEPEVPAVSLDEAEPVEAYEAEAGEPAIAHEPLPSVEPESETVESPPPPASLDSTEVRPPTDVEGPGWAFTTTKIPTATGGEAQHEEARRLARLLVTEIKLYNEQVVEQGRAARDIYSRLRDDIERSRRIFEDRIDPEVRSEKDYFHEALVRILGGGDAAVLGV